MNNYLLGIEYSKQRIKATLLKQVGKKYSVHSLQSFVSDATNTAENQFKAWKTENLGQLKIKAVVSLSESLIFFKELVIPATKRLAIDEAVYWDLAQNSPIPPSEAIYEWTKIESTNVNTVVSAMAIRDSVVNQILLNLQDSGIEVIAFEPASMSLSRAINLDAKKNTMLLLVGEHETDIVVLKNGRPVFSTNSDVSLSRSKEGKWKLDSSVSDQIAKKTNELIEYWENKNEVKIQQILITGDLVDKYFGLAKSINKFAKIPVNIARQKRLESVYFSEIAKAIVNRYYISIGAALRLLKELNVEEVNLTTKTQKEKLIQENNNKIKSIRLSIANRSLMYFLIGMLLIALSYGLTSAYLGKTILSVDNQIKSHPGQKLISRVNTTNDYLSKIAIMQNSKKSVDENLIKLSNLTPKEIKLESVEYLHEKQVIWKIVGRGSREAVLAYQQRLESESGASRVTMPYSNLDNDQENVFEINLIW